MMRKLFIKVITKKPLNARTNHAEASVIEVNDLGNITVGVLEVKTW